MNSRTQRAHENFLRAANVPLPQRMADGPVIHAVDFTVLCCPECGEIENADSIGRLMVCPKCGTPIPWVLRGDPHKGK